MSLLESISPIARALLQGATTSTEMTDAAHPRNWLTAYCYRNGRIFFTSGKLIPATALPIACGEPGLLRGIIMGTCRLSYPKKRGGKDRFPLVPGVPEAADEQSALQALFDYRNRVRVSLGQKEAK